MAVQKNSKDITYYEECFNYVGSQEIETPLHNLVDFMVMFLVNPTYATQQMGSDEGEENNGGNNGSGGPTIDRDNLCPFYGLFYAMVMVGQFDEHDNAVDMTKPYAVFGKVIQKLKRL